MKLLEVLALLATDTEFMSAFRASPHDALSRSGLNSEDQRVLLDGDPIALRQAVFAEQATAAGGPAGEIKAEELPYFGRPEPPPSPQPGPGPEPPYFGRPEPPPSPQPGPGPEPPYFGRPEPPPSPQPGPGPEPPYFGRPEPPPSPQPGPGPEPPYFGRPEPPPSPQPGPGPEPPYFGAPEPPPPPPSEPPYFGNPEPPPEPPNESATAHEAESAAVEPLDLELDLAQDAILAGLNSSRAVDLDPCGVWSAKGLTVVGMGMRAGLHMTVETRLAIEQTSRVLYVVADPVSEACILKLNPNAESLWHMYQTGKPRIEIYESIIAKILDELESAGDVCVAFYGHAAVLSYPAWESIRRARATGRRARMLPAISTEDSLFADLGVDIGRAGLQSFEATRFLYYEYNFDTSAGLLLWQLGGLGETKWNPPHVAARPRIQVLTDYLTKFYGPEHEVYLYHAPQLPTSRALIERVALRDLPRAEFISISTLYLPPRGQPKANEENLRALARIEVRK